METKTKGKLSSDPSETRRFVAEQVESAINSIKQSPGMRGPFFVRRESVSGEYSKDKSRK